MCMGCRLTHIVLHMAVERAGFTSFLSGRLLVQCFCLQLGTHYSCPRPVSTGRGHRPWTRVVYTELYTGNQHGPWTRVSFFDTRVHGPWTRVRVYSAYELSHQVTHNIVVIFTVSLTVVCLKTKLSRVELLGFNKYWKCLSTESRAMPVLGTDRVK